MGLVLCPADGDTNSPDAAWSYTGFSAFRRWLAEAEGFELSEMSGFGGQRRWTDVSTTLAPLLNHPDDEGPDLTPAQCTALLPRLEEIVGQAPTSSSDPVHRRHLDEARQLVVVLQLCLEKDVGLLFC